MSNIDVGDMEKLNFQQRAYHAAELYSEISSAIWGGDTKWLKTTFPGAILSTRPKNGEKYLRVVGLNVYVGPMESNQIFIFEISANEFKITRTSGANRKRLIAETTSDKLGIQNAIKFVLGLAKITETTSLTGKD